MTEVLAAARTPLQQLLILGLSMLFGQGKANGEVWAPLLHSISRLRLMS